MVKSRHLLARKGALNITAALQVQALLFTQPNVTLVYQKTFETCLRVNVFVYLCVIVFACIVCYVASVHQMCR